MQIRVVRTNIDTYVLVLSRVHISAGGLLVPGGIIRPVISVSSLTWFIRYICYWNLQLLNNVIIIKSKVLSIFSFICMFCRSLFVLLSFFTWPLCCLFFDLRILITSLVSSCSSSPLLGIGYWFWRSCLGLLLCLLPKLLNYLAFQPPDLERTWWRLFQKRVVRTKFDIYVFIKNGKFEAIVNMISAKHMTITLAT